MSSANRTVLVIGATGHQGGAAARHLLADGWRVKALVRNPRGPRATRLADAGVELIAGDLDDRGSVDTAVRGAYGVFSVQPALIAPDFAENELQRGLNVAEAAHRAGVGQLVYASVASAERGTGIPHWEIKWEIEQHIRKLGLPATVLRPVMFMENFADSHYGLRGKSSLIRTIPADVTVQLIALDDIGAFAALAFAAPERFLGQAIELAGDELTLDQLHAELNRATGSEVLEIAGTAPASSALGPPGGTTSSFCGWQADIPALRTLYPALQDFPTWLTREGAALFEKHYREAGLR
jgi:uncharacterized protein YbjT (DUF2867 family)